MAGAAMYQRKPLIVNGSPVIGIGGPVYEDVFAEPTLTPSTPFTVRRRATSETYTPYIAESGPIAEPTGFQLPPWIFPAGIGILLLIVFNAGRR